MLACMLIIHPRNFADETLYAIDQFVLGGGRATIFVDPHCEADPAGQSNPMMQQQQPPGSAASNLNRLFQAWGFEMVPSKVAGDRQTALRVQYQDGQGRMKEGPFVVWLSLGADDVNSEDAITSRIDLGLRMNSAGILRATAAAETSFTPLANTSQESMEIDAGMLMFRPNPDSLMRNFVPGFQRLALAARVTGEASSAFPDGDPTAATPVDEEGADESPAVDTGHLARSNGPINVVAVADVDMLVDNQWVREQRLMNISLGFTKLSDNGDFLVNAVENLLGGSDLISIQSRGNYARPFGRVDQIRLDAEQRFRSEEMELERRLGEVSRRIQELQSDAAPGTTSVLVPEDLIEQIAQARQDELDTKRELRNVQLNMRKDIERLGSRLKWMNIGLIPVLVSAAAIALGAWRVQRRTKGA